MNIFESLKISSSGLSSQRLRMDIISDNIANADTTRTADGGPYKRKSITFQESVDKIYDNKSRKFIDNPQGVKVAKILEDSNFKKVYDPSNPDADKDGNVLMPNVNSLNEMVDLISASRSFEANVTAMTAEKQMAMKALEIGK